MKYLSLLILLAFGCKKDSGTAEVKANPTTALDTPVILKDKVVEVYYNPGCQHAYRLLYPHNFLHIQFNTGLPTDTFKDQSPNNPVTYTRIARGRSIFIECFSEVSYGISDSSCSCGLTVKVDGVLKYSTHNGIEKTIDIYK